MSKEMLGELEVFASLTPEQVEVLEQAVERRVAGHKSFLHQQSGLVALTFVSGVGSLGLFLAGLATGFEMALVELFEAAAGPLLWAAIPATLPSLFTLVLISGLRLLYADHLRENDHA